MSFCSKCKYEIPDDMSFCNKCGSPVNGTKIIKDTGRRKNIFINRESQLIGAAISVPVKVDGIFLGNIKVGKSISTQSIQEFTTVEIIAPEKTKMQSLMLRLNAGAETIISIKYNLEGILKFSVQATVTGAEILEQQTY